MSDHSFQDMRPAAYIAAPLFNQSERSFNLELAETIAKYCNVFLPQRDGLLLSKLIYDGMNISDARNLVFKADVASISSSNILIAVLDGRTIDEGVCFEIGYANALNILCIGLKSDDRSLLPSGDNPMIVCGCKHIFSSILDLEVYISAYVISLAKGCPIKFRDHEIDSSHQFHHTE